MKVTELVNLLGTPLPVRPVAVTEAGYAEAVRVFREMYAPGLTAFFETVWFLPGNLRQETFSKDLPVVARLLSLLKVLESVSVSDHASMASCGVLEARIVWELACLAYTIPAYAFSTTPVSGLETGPAYERDVVEVKSRVLLVDALLSGSVLASNPANKAVAVDGQQTSRIKARELEFWHTLGELLCSVPVVDADGTDTLLRRLRGLLDGRENRDVLYSMAVARTHAPRFEPNFERAVLPQHLDETEARNRLAVASRFLQNQARVSGGTTNVVRRLCDLAVRSFISPGVNVDRQTAV